MRTGCIFTLKNEEALIAHNMLYHRHIGVTDFFVFLDHSTDDTKNILSSMPDTRIFENMSYEELHTNGRIIKEKYLLHYNIVSFRHFLEKFKNYRDFPQFTSFGHKVRPLRMLFVRLANDPQKTEDELMEYYKNHIMYTNRDIQIIKKELTAPFLEIHAVSSFFREQ